MDKYVNSQLAMEVVMIFEKQADLLDRKRRLSWTNREIGNALGVAPGVASSKLNGFIILTGYERQRLEKAMSAAEAETQRELDQMRKKESP